MKNIKSNLSYLKKFGSYLQENPEMISLFQQRSQFIHNIRDYLDKIGAIELEMPCLQIHREEAPVHQFVTTHPLTGEKFYLRHCMATHLRRICNAFGQVYEIGKAFRVEKEDDYRANEFTVLEYVSINKNLQQGIDIIKKLITESILTTFRELKLNGINFGNIEIISFDELMFRVIGFGMYDNQFRERSIIKLDSIGCKIDQDVEDWKIYEELLKYFLEPSIIQPTIIVDYPVELQHNTEIDEKKNVAKRYSMIIKGVEVCDGGEKLTNSVSYRAIYQENAEYKKRYLGISDTELPQDYFDDIDYRPTQVFTSGVGIDRLFAICTEKTIHEVVLFPFH